MRVDIKKVLREKAPGVSRWMPWFVKNYLRRIVHEDEINFYLENFSHLPTIEFIRASLAHMGITYTAVGIERLDPHGRYIFASNHPFGGVDGLMLADEVSRAFGQVRVVVNDLLMNLAPLAPIFIPVNKHGRQRPEYTQMFREAFESDMQIITFPAGLVSRRQNGTIADLEWRPNFVKQAVAHHRDIVPVLFEGRLSNFFYSLSAFRKKVGIKANIEMLYLPDEMFRQGGSHFNIIIGEPVAWQSLEGVTPKDAALAIRNSAYALKNRVGVDDIR